MNGKKTQSLKPSDFVHLHNHTQYSLLDGLTRVPDLIDFVQDTGMTSVAKTDHGTMSGTIEFYKTAKAKDVNPIIGMETYIAARKHTDKESGKDKKRYHLILLAMNNQGYHNLMKLSSIANLDGFYYYPRIDHDLLEKYGEGLIALSGCMSGEIGDALKNGQYDEAKKIATWYKKVFGDRYYLEIQDHGHPDNPLHSTEQAEINSQVLKLGKEVAVPVVVTCDAHYLRHEDQGAHEILLCVGTGSFLSDERRMSLKDFPLHVESPDEIIKRWGKDNPEVITNTRAVADRCNVTIELGKILIPKFPVPKGEDEKSYLRKLVWQGLAWRYGGEGQEKSSKLSIAQAQNLLPAEIVERTDYELGVMDDMGYNGYFLIVQDFINWGKAQGIIFGPGRGSAAGSIVSYALRITEIDPMKYNLMFERFLNPSRISMPDIDIDIQDTRRDEVIQYCVDKYGSERVANIVTFGRMFARNAIRDVARVMQVPYAEADRLAKMIPPPVQGRHIPLEQSLQDTPELKSEYENNPTSKQVFDMALILEGTIRSHGIHAAGVVIAPDEIVKFAPLEMAQKGVVSTQYPMGPVEELGLLKMDFLGLSNLTILKNALRIIKKVYSQDIDLGKIPNDDPKTFELFRRGDTTGVFQFESAGMKRYLKDLQPTEFSDLVAMNALYRPGPMAEIPRFVKGKNDASSVTYLHESLEPILNETYGVMVYQEQIIKLLQLVAGYTPGEADLVRKAIGKKKRDIMNAEEPKFIKGCVHQGLSEQQAKKLWAQIQPFADYSFNKAHATCYSQIAYWTAYLKANFPDAFMAALMTSAYGDTDRLAIEISECRHMGIEVLAPDVNESFEDFAVVPGKNQIRFGLSSIKNVGAGAVEVIVEERSKNGKFEDIINFLDRVDPRRVNRKVWESLIKTGTFEGIYASRSDLLYNLDRLLAYASGVHKDRTSDQSDIFGGLDTIAPVSLPKPEITTSPNQASDSEALLWERELLGLYLSKHPLDNYSDYLVEQAVPIAKINSKMEGRDTTIGGVIENIRKITTKNGANMAFIKVADSTAELELIVFPKVYEQLSSVWVVDGVVLVKGKISYKTRDGDIGDDLKLIAEQANLVSVEDVKAYKAKGKRKKLPKEAKSSSVPKNSGSTPETSTDNSKVRTERLWLNIKDTSDTDTLSAVKNILDEYPGSIPVVMVLGDSTNKQALQLPQKVVPNDELLSKLADRLGESSVVLK